jgi:predicted pyridoxine 5'-phosphate oxidase superfamily flavin-nucleotide-binding protein
LKLADEVKAKINEIHPALVATADRTGKPNVSPKGSLRVLDDEHLLFADISSPRTIKNIWENPQVAVICLDAKGKKGCRIWGNAEVFGSGPLFLQEFNKFAPKEMRVNHIVKIRVTDFESF